MTAPHDLHLRHAIPADAEPLARLINDAFRSERFFSDEDRTNPAGVRDYMRKGIFLLLEKGKNLVGCVYLEPRGERFYLGLLSVEPTRQGAGIGSYLMQLAEDHCRAAGARVIDLRIVNVRTELPTYYHRFGYRESGTAPFPPHAKTTMPCHFVIMSKELTAGRAAELHSDR
jgi:predicted N-acetyltransferase YhbS